MAELLSRRVITALDMGGSQASREFVLDFQYISSKKTIAYHQMLSIDRTYRFELIYSNGDCFSFSNITKC